jgi:diguanylate cyclase (GGDEF)-like protein
MKEIEEIVKYTSKLKLLYVEDDASTREASMFLLENFFDTIIVAENGKDGIEKFRENDVDIIITDINMPYLNGLEMTAEIQKIDPDAKVIIFSANMEPKYFTESIRLGVDGYLIKPIEVDHLINILDKIVTSFRLQDEIKHSIDIEKENQQYLQSIVDASHDPIMLISKEYKVGFMSKSVRAKMDRHNIEDTDNPKCYEVLYNRTIPCGDGSYPCPLDEMKKVKKPITVIHHRKYEDKNDVYMEMAATPMLDDNNNCIGIVEISRDITSHIKEQDSLKEQKKILHHKAHHDALTGIANKIMFESRLLQAIHRAKEANGTFALLFMDLNKFKWINDNKGHDAGDAVLMGVVQSVARNIRTEDTFARIGGDEFTIIIENIDNRDELKRFAEKILESIEEPIDYLNEELSVSASIGIAIYPDDCTILDTLLKYADTAMYSAKYSDTNISFYHDRVQIV